MSGAQPLPKGAAWQNVSWFASGRVNVACGVGGGQRIDKGNVCSVGLTTPATATATKKVICNHQKAVVQRLLWRLRLLRPAKATWLLSKFQRRGCASRFLWCARVFGALQAFAPEAGRHLPALPPSLVAICLAFCLVANSACRVAGGFLAANPAPGEKNRGRGVTATASVVVVALEPGGSFASWRATQPVQCDGACLEQDRASAGFAGQARHA